MAINNSSKSTARERLTCLFDEGTFVEIGAYVMKRGDDITKSEELEGVVCGWGAIDGRLVYAFAQDYSRAKGAMSEYHAKKIISLYRLAVENGSPIIGVFDSAGALIPEGIRSVAGYGKIMNAAANASGVIPQIALVAGNCTGASSVIAGMYDFAVALDGVGFSFTPSFNLDDKVSASADGLATASVSSEAELFAYARKLISYLPSNNSEGTVMEISGDDASRAVDISSYLASHKASDIVSQIADRGEYLELYKSYADDVFTAFASVANTVCGITATNGGRLTPMGARKAARFVSFCDAFDIPVVTLLDCQGTVSNAINEKAPYSAELAKLSMAYATAKCPLVTVVTGEAYGTVLALFGSKANGADVVYALESAKLGAMNAASAVAFMQNDKIGGKVSREELEREYSMKMGSASAAAAAGEVDDIIADGEIRARIAAAVLMLSSKSKNQPTKRHISFPL